MNYENAYKLYLETIVCAMGRSATPSDLVTKLTHLRQAISCYVCYNLLQEPHSSVGVSCQHYVCRQCVGGKLRLPAGGRSTCAMCKQSESFQPDPHLPWLLSAYGSLCRYIKSTLRFQSGELNKIANGARYNFNDIVQEGSQMSRFEPPDDTRLTEVKLEENSADDKDATAEPGETIRGTDGPGTSDRHRPDALQPRIKKKAWNDYTDGTMKKPLNSEPVKSEMDIVESPETTAKRPRGRPKSQSRQYLYSPSVTKSHKLVSPNRLNEPEDAIIDQPISKRTRKSLN